jgi:hypothetical protein
MGHADLQKFGTLVFDTIGELAGNKGNDRRLAFTTLEWLQGIA